MAVTNQYPPSLDWRLVNAKKIKISPLSSKRNPNSRYQCPKSKRNVGMPEWNGGVGGLFHNIVEGIDRDLIQMDLVMEMRAGRPAGGADQANGFAPFHVLPLFYERLFEVSIFGLKPVAVLNDNDPAVSPIPAAE